MQKIKYLSAEYLGEMEKRGSRMPAKPGLNIEIQHLIRDTPGGEDISYYLTIRDGQLVAARLGTLDKPSCSLRMSYQNSVKMTTGDLKPLVGLMTGKIRPGGDVAKLRSMVPTLQTPEFQVIADEVHRMTDY